MNKELSERLQKMPWKPCEFKQQPKPAPKPKTPPPPPRCPACSVKAMELWKMNGRTYLKCKNCDYEVG